MSNEVYNKDNSSHLFSISYATRELSCIVQRRNDILDVEIDHELNARLRLEPDDTLQQIKGDPLPDAIIDIIKTRVIDGIPTDIGY